MASERKQSWNGKVVLGAFAIVLTLSIAVVSSWVTVKVTLASTETRMDYAERDLAEIKQDVKELGKTVTEIHTLLQKR